MRSPSGKSMRLNNQDPLHSDSSQNIMSPLTKQHEKFKTKGENIIVYLPAVNLGYYSKTSNPNYLAINFSKL